MEGLDVESDVQTLAVEPEEAPNSPLKKGTGSEPTGESSAENRGYEVPVPLFQRAAKAASPARPSITVPLDYEGVVRRIATPHRYHAIEKMLAANDRQYARLLRKLSQHTDSLFQIPLKKPDDDREPYFENTGYFSHMDAVALYLLVAHFRPRRIIEVGSGSSTKYMRRAITDGGLATHITSIDPHPRSEIDAICDQIVRQNVLDVPADFFRSLESGDFLFVDGSHLAFAGTDTPHIFFEVLPVLKPGVVVHFHDIFLPRDYPAAPAWQDMYYGEQYVLAALLGRGADYTVLLPNYYLGNFRRELVIENLDLSKAPATDQVCFTGGASFWIQKRESAFAAARSWLRRRLGRNDRGGHGVMALLSRTGR
jgi:predicted O-methyltransferase YrrM